MDKTKMKLFFYNIIIIIILFAQIQVKCSSKTEIK